MQMQGGQEEAPLLYFHITVLLLSSPNKQTQKPVGEKMLTTSQIYWGGKKKKRATAAERDAEEQITRPWYQLDPQDGAISVPAVLHPRQQIAVPIRRKPKERASIDTLRRQNNCFYGLHNREAIIPFFPSLVSYQVPRQITHSCEGTHWDGKT